MNNKALFSTGENERGTPQWLFDDLNRFFDFTIDAAASDSLHVLDRYWTTEDDGLTMPWEGEFAYINPPYESRKQNKWVEKAAQEFIKNRVQSIMLIPSRTDTRRWHEFIFPVAERVYFIEGRLKFVLPDGKFDSNSTFPSALVFFVNSWASAEALVGFELETKIPGYMIRPPFAIGRLSQAGELQ